MDSQSIIRLNQAGYGVEGVIFWRIQTELLSVICADIEALDWVAIWSIPASASDPDDNTGAAPCFGGGVGWWGCVCVCGGGVSRILEVKLVIV